MRPRSLSVEPLEDRLAPAAVGTLDPSFGDGGLAGSFEFQLQHPNPIAMTVDHLGRAVAASEIDKDGSPSSLVVRFNPDGTPDSSFGTNGAEVLTFVRGTYPTAVAVDADNNVAVVGFGFIATGPPVMAVTRLLGTTGLPDPEFGTDGTAFIPAPAGTNGGISPLGVTTDADGDIVVVGSTDFRKSFVARLTPTGTLDPTFNGGEIKVVEVSPTEVYIATTVAISHSGNIVVGGTRSFDLQYGMMVFELLPSGVLDPAFNGGAILATPDLPAADAFALALDANDNIYLAGASPTSSPTNSLTAVVKVTAAGALDTTFANSGLFTGDAGAASGIAVQPDGQVDVGSTDNFQTYIVTQLLPNGTLDPSFNPAGPCPGQISFPVGAESQNHSLLRGLALTPAGGIVVGGSGQGFDGDMDHIDLAEIIGPPRKPPADSTELAVGGATDGTANLFDSSATGEVNATPLATVAAFGSTTANVRTAVADVDEDGTEDTILVTGPGTAIRFAVVSGADNKTVLVPPTAPFAGSEDFNGGGFVAAADFDRDGRAEIIVSPDEGGGPRVTIFSLGSDGKLSTRANFLGIGDPNFRGGARVAAGDVNADGTPDLAVAAGFGGGPRIALYDGATVTGGNPTELVNDFFAFPDDAETLRNGAYVAVGDFDGDGYADLIFGGGPGGAPRIFVLAGARITSNNVLPAQEQPLANFFVAGNSADRGGVRVAMKDLDGDGQGDLVVGSGEDTPANVRVYLGKNFTGTTEPAESQDFAVFGGAALGDGVFVG